MKKAGKSLADRESDATVAAEAMSAPRWSADPVARLNAVLADPAVVGALSRLSGKTRGALASTWPAAEPDARVMEVSGGSSLTSGSSLMCAPLVTVLCGDLGPRPIGGPVAGPVCGRTLVWSDYLASGRPRQGLAVIFYAGMWSRVAGVETDNWRCDFEPVDVADACAEWGVDAVLSGLRTALGQGLAHSWPTLQHEVVVGLMRAGLAVVVDADAAPRGVEVM